MMAPRPNGYDPPLFKGSEREPFSAGTLWTDETRQRALDSAVFCVQVTQTIKGADWLYEANLGDKGFEAW